MELAHDLFDFQQECPEGHNAWGARVPKRINQMADGHVDTGVWSLLSESESADMSTLVISGEPTVTTIIGLRHVF